MKSTIMKIALILVPILICVAILFMVMFILKPKEKISPTLSLDKKTIVAGDKDLLSIDDDAIFNWFKNNSQLCDPSNFDSNSDRNLFCESRETFKKLTRFSSIVISPDSSKIGFEVESDTLSPDRVVGIYSVSDRKTNILTNYYLGNKFIGFSPNGKNFVYQSACFEALCGLFIKNSESLADVANMNNPEYLDAREKNTVFVRWISDDEIEYKLGEDLKREVLNTDK